MDNAVYIQETCESLIGCFVLDCCLVVEIHTIFFKPSSALLQQQTNKQQEVCCVFMAIDVLSSSFIITLLLLEFCLLLATFLDTVQRVGKILSQSSHYVEQNIRHEMISSRFVCDASDCSL